jgi:hypothetical protein
MENEPEFDAIIEIRVLAPITEISSILPILN